MTAPDRTKATVDPSPGEDPLEPRVERLAALRSAWGVLAPFGVSGKGREIAQAGRVVTDQLAEWVDSDDAPGANELRQIDASLDAFESSMGRLAAQISVPQLRSTLPAQLDVARRGMLDVLDLLIAPDPAEPASPRGSVAAIDYLITLLCTSQLSTGSSIRHDPVTLTPRLQALCERADEADDPRVSEVEAEFFAASGMDVEDLREEIQLRNLRSRKAELGLSFFAPRVLRAIVTYNAALFDRVAHEILDSGDWGLVKNGQPDAGAPRSLFESEPLRAIALAVRRRADGAKPEPNPYDRIAWALDFDYLDEVERKALLGDKLGTQEDPLGSAILLGLMCRSLAVLSIEIQAVGISPEDVSDIWIAELGEIFQREINQKIASDAYKAACALSELKNKFLFAPLADGFREKVAPRAPARPRVVEPARSPQEKPENARDLLRSALEETRRAPAKPAGGIRSVDWPWARLLQIGAAGAVAIAVLGFIFAQPDGDLRRWSHDQLESISPHLVRGHRNGEGAGHAFVGTIDDAWLALPVAEREAAAEQLVVSLRNRGLNQIMIYDREDRLRIQAVGIQPIRTL